MSAGYRAVQWSPAKRVYDGVVGALLVLYLAVFVAITFAVRPEITVETVLIRSFGTAALLLLHLVLAIGPLARIDRRFLPLLWNRRHLGVTMFVCALAHGGLALFQFHFLGDRNPLVSLWVSNGRFESLAQFPFQPLGFVALAILFLMAATSHDFWLANLTAPVWKALHTAVYLAYALIVAHVALGPLQDERSPLLGGMLLLGLAAIVSLHVAAAAGERAVDREVDRKVESASAEGFVEIGRVEEIAEGRAKVVTLSGERVAVFRWDGKVAAISNVCQHQNGPLGEGRIVDGCVTCPWHGYQYRPEDGASPPPFTERVPTFRVRLAGSRILVDPRPLAPGTRVEPARFDPALPPPAERTEFFVGYLPMPPALKRFATGVAGGLAVLFVAVAALGAAAQRPLGAGEFEFGSLAELDGLLRLEPLPALWRSASDELPIEVVPLVGRGKHGPPAAVRALAGREVRASGSWIRRGRESLFEIAGARPLDAAAGLAARAATARLPLGPAELAGEIVDTKCYLGVMKPGEGKSHKACAIRCISGGAPAALVARSGGGEVAVLWLVGRDGRPLGSELLDLVAEPVVIAGELVRVGDRVLLVTERGNIRRVDGPAS